ncbi:hypothetical protein Tco_0311800 [Tanacetum coccineum]
MFLPVKQQTFLVFAHRSANTSYNFWMTKKPVFQKRRRLSPNMQEVVKKEIVKLLDTGIIYPIDDSPSVSPIHCVAKKGGITVVTNKNDELVPTRTVTGWRVCIDYRKLNEATAKDHFPSLFMDQMLEILPGNKYFCFLDGFSGYFQIPIDPNDQEKTTFTCPFGTYAYRRMPFGYRVNVIEQPMTRSGIGLEDVQTCYHSNSMFSYVFWDFLFDTPSLASAAICQIRGCYIVISLPKFLYHKEELCPSCEQGKSKKAPHPPKPVPNLKRRLHLLYMHLCCPMRFTSITGKRYVLVIVDYARYTWVHFLISKDDAPEVIKTFLKKITVDPTP